MASVLAIVALAATSLHLVAAAGDPRQAAEQLIRSWDNGAMYTPWACGVIAEGYQIVPGSDWGSTPGDIMQKWKDSNCDLKICAHFVAKYGIIPKKSWGAMPSKLVPGWEWQRPNSKGNCNDLWLTGAAGVTSPKEASNGPAVYSPWGCGVVSTGFELVPGSDWGSMPGEVQAKWTDSACDVKICAFYVSKYDVVPGQSLGSLPELLQKAWQWDRPGGVGSCDNLWSTPL